jgi:hypothetical protein
MKWTYDLTGAEPIIKDVAVYDATTIQDGELLQLGLAAAGFYTAGTGTGFASACPTTVGATQGINALGIALETKTTADTPSIAALHNLTTGAFCYVKAIINPFAVYRAWVNTSSTGTVANNQITAASSATATDLAQVVLSVLGTTGYFDSQWVYFSASAGANYGQLRMIASSASAATLTLDTACLSTFSSDKCSFISQPGTAPNVLGLEAMNVGQCSSDPATATNLMVVENYIDRGLGIELLREKAHAGGRVSLNSAQAKVAKFYQDIICTDHIYGTD